MRLLSIATDYERLSIKLAQDTTMQAQKLHYAQIINLDKKINELWTLISKNPYTDQIKNYIKNIFNIIDVFARKAYNKGITKDESISAQKNMVGIVNAVKILIPNETLKPFDEMVKALNNWTPIDLPAQNNASLKPL